MKRIAVTSTLALVFALIGAMWIYALFFASKEVVNEINDRAWTERAEIICKAAATERIALADFRPITDAGVGALL